MMQISIIGSGRVGLSLGALLAKSGFSVFMTDKDFSKKQSVTGESLAFYEPDLEKLIQDNQNHLKWTRQIDKILSSDFIFLSLSTPVQASGTLDLKEVFGWTERIVEHTQREKFLIIKSTFPLGTNKTIQKQAEQKKVPLHVISCPEFLRQGQALKDLIQPERLVIGCRDKHKAQKLEELYKNFSEPKQVIYTDPETAELSKLACNAFLANKISFMNEFAGLCEKIKGQPQDLKLILSSDSRIGEGFLNPGLGWGGYCLPKDVQMSLYEGHKRGLSMDLLKASQKLNASLVDDFFYHIYSYYKNLQSLTLSFWGISFKKHTDDLKNSPALNLACRLLKAGVKLKIYDPLFVGEKVFMFLNKKRDLSSSQKSFSWKSVFQKSYFQHEDQLSFLRQKILSGKVLFCSKPLESLKNAEGLIIGSDWEEFQQIGLANIKKNLKKAFLVDGRNLFHIEDLKREGFSFYQRACFFIQDKDQTSKN